jgi:hypothetical protein
VRARCTWSHRPARNQPAVASPYVAWLNGEIRSASSTQVPSTKSNVYMPCPAEHLWMEESSNQANNNGKQARTRSRAWLLHHSIPFRPGLTPVRSRVRPDRPTASPPRAWPEEDTPMHAREVWSPPACTRSSPPRTGVGVARVRTRPPPQNPSNDMRARPTRTLHGSVRKCVSPEDRGERESPSPSSPTTIVPTPGAQQQQRLQPRQRLSPGR